MDAPRAGGLLASLRALVATGVALLQTRLELLSVELQDEQLRLRAMLLYGVAAVLLGAFGLVFVAVFVTVLLWDSHRLLALGIFSALFLAAGIACAAVTARHARSGSKLFSASLAELRRDREALGGEK